MKTLFATSSDVGDVIASRICPMETIWEPWQKLFRRAEHPGSPRLARDIQPQSTRVLNRIEGLPVVKLKGADANGNG
jgi:hypothetical protein